MNNRRVATGLTVALVSTATVAVMSLPTGAGAASAKPGGHHDATAQKTTHGKVVVDAKSSKDKAKNAAASFVAKKPAALKLSTGDKAVQAGTFSSGGLQYVSYQRQHDGLEVVGGDFVVATDAQGNLLTTSVAQKKPVSVSTTTPKLSKADAEKVAKAQLFGPTLESTDLVILQQDSGSKLAYESIVHGTKDGSYSRLTVYTDAATGAVLKTVDHVADGTGSGTFNGPKPVTFGTTASGSTFTMKDPNETNLSCQDEGNTPFSQSSDSGWGGGSSTDKETACVDALYDADTERAMLSAWDGRNGHTGSGGAWPIHIGDPEENAYYDGTQVQIGYDDDGTWLTPMDVVAHEMGHGVDDNTPGGISGNGTQEFVADTFGAATEWYANQSSSYDKPDFTVGEEVNLGGGPIRYMYNPSLLGDANCYSSSIPSAEVHSAAGPGNHWFYLLAEGTSPTNGQPTSPTCNSSSITGVGIQKAEQIMYNAMLLKTSSSSYLKYRTWTLTAAKNLDSTCALFNTTKAAWDAVSVPAQSADPTCSGSGGGTGSITVASPGSKTGTVGTAISSFSVTASGGTAPYTYTATGLPAGVSISSSGTVSGTPTTAATYNPTVTATDSTGKTGSVSFTFTISGSGGGGTTCSGNKITNGGFESGTSGWTASSGVITNDTGGVAHGGSYYAWLDGYGQTHTDTLSQSVTIPSGCTAKLTFYIFIDTEETGSTAYDKLTVKAGSTTLATYSNVNANDAYVAKTLTLSGTGTQTITFTGSEDSTLATSFLIDDVAVNLS